MRDITAAHARRARAGTAPEAARGDVLQRVRDVAEPAGVTTLVLTRDDLQTIEVRP
jgi:hypothetical protein